MISKLGIRAKASPTPSHIPESIARLVPTTALTPFASSSTSSRFCTDPAFTRRVASNAPSGASFGMLIVIVILTSPPGRTIGCAGEKVTQSEILDGTVVSVVI